MDRNETAALLVPLAPRPTAAPRLAAVDAAFLAHALGQGGQARGLRGGPRVLAGARTAYLSAEWSGADDRRPAPGLLRRDSV